MAPIDDGLLQQARAAVGRRLDAEAALAHARTDEQLALRRLQLAGASVREIARALGISHQRVHQLIDAVDDGRGWKRKAAPAKGAALQCTFCGRGSDVVAKLIAGPGCYICDACVANARHGFDGRPACSFCGKRALPDLSVRGTDDVAICSQCLDLCDEILTEDPPDGSGARVRP